MSYNFRVKKIGDKYLNPELMEKIQPENDSPNFYKVKWNKET